MSKRLGADGNAAFHPIPALSGSPERNQAQLHMLDWVLTFN